MRIMSVLFVIVHFFMNTFCLTQKPKKALMSLIAMGVRKQEATI